MTAATRTVRGGSFLIEERDPSEVFTPEDLTEEHRAIARTASQFFAFPGVALEQIGVGDGSRAGQEPAGESSESRDRHDRASVRISPHRIDGPSRKNPHATI